MKDPVKRRDVYLMLSIFGGIGLSVVLFFVVYRFRGVGDALNKLAFDGSGYLSWEGLICMQEIGKCTEEHQAIVRKWLEARKLEDVRTSELFDVWWD